MYQSGLELWKLFALIFCFVWTIPLLLLVHYESSVLMNPKVEPPPPSECTAVSWTRKMSSIILEMGEFAFSDTKWPLEGTFIQKLSLTEPDTEA